MNATKTPPSTTPFSVIQVLAQLLEKLDRSPVAADAAQYQAVVRRLGAELAQAAPGAALSAVLDAYPAAAELYENIRYEHAGLCRSPLDASLQAELKARQAIDRALHRRPVQGSPDAQI